MKKIAILYDYSDVSNYLKLNPSTNFCLPLTPNAKSLLLSKAPDTKLLDPLDFFKEDDHEKILTKTYELKKKFDSFINDLKILECSKITISNVIDLSLNSFFYIDTIMQNIKCEYLIYHENKFLYSKTTSVITEVIIKKIIREGYGIFAEKRNEKQYFSFFNEFLLKIIIILVRKKNVIWTTGLNYGLKNLITKSSKKNSSIFFYLGNANKFSIFKNIKNIINLLIKKKSFYFEIIPTKKFKRNYYFENLRIDNNEFDILNYEFVSYLEMIINYLESIYISSKNFLILSKSNTTISHQFRILEPSLIGMIGKHLNINNILISHGSHVIPKNDLEKIALNNQAKDILVSKFATHFIIQSPLALDSIKKFKKLNVENYLLYKPIMWGYKKNTLNKKYNKSRKITLLHASTSKTLCVRPLIYETSNEYINSLNTLCNCVNKNNNFELIIKVRSTKECSINSIKQLVKTGNNCKIIYDIDFVDLLDQCDYLLSYSSTTIEESLNAFKPVIIYGYSNRYIHINADNKIIFNANPSNIEQLLINIYKSNNLKSIQKKDYYKYIWKDEMKNIDNFISDFFSIQ